LLHRRPADRLDLWRPLGAVNYLGRFRRLLTNMLRYRVFGGVFATPFPFPELRADHGKLPCDWTLRVSDTALPLYETVAVGEDELAMGITARMMRTSLGLRLDFDDTGTFDISGRGSSITWYPVAGSDPELVRIDILGRVLAAAAHEQGILCLHGSAVSMGGQAIGFLAPKGFGKSTLASSLVSAGARLLTDDTLPVEPSTGMARPGVHSVRLLDDAANHFWELGHGRLGLSEKQTFDSIPDQLVEEDAVPLAALYLLVPRRASEVAEMVRREAVMPHVATFGLMQHSKLGALLGGSEARHIFDRCARVAGTVPVFTLEIGRSLDAIGDVASMIVRWHS
jgi:hypothetical protein